MRIGFDISQTGKAKAGCGYFADGLIRQLAAAQPRHEYILYPAVGDIFWDPECASATFQCNQPNFRRLNAPRDFEASRQFWRNPGKDFEESLGSPDVFHANNFYCPRGFQTARLVYTLYDLSFLVEPEWTTEQNRAGCFAGVFQASLNADYIVAISRYSRDQFLSTFPHYPAERMEIVYPASRFAGMAPTAARPDRLKELEPGKFWLSVGTIEPRKNHVRLLEAYRLLKARDQSAYPLVLAGGNGWLMKNFDAVLRGVERDVILPGYASDGELEWLFANCYGFVYPSLFEGFGMPVLEALGLGAAVLCSQTSSLPEAAGDAAIFFDPLDPRSIAAAMAKLSEGEGVRDRLRSAALKQAKRFSWASSADRLSGVYEEAAALPRLVLADGRLSCPAAV